MLFEIEHITTYKYSKSVFFEPLTVRLRPLCNSFQKVHDFNMEIEPEPAGMSHIIDFYGNEAVTVWFNGVHSFLNIRTKSKVETNLENPYNFIITNPFASTLPIDEDMYDLEIVKPYLKNMHESTELEGIVKKIIEQENGNTFGFINSLCTYIYDNFTQISRTTGDPYHPDTTIKESKGACRDLTVLMIEGMRTVNLPARFVSGYSYGTVEGSEEDLHSWVEVYLPGAGWKGYDPNLGLAVDNTYIKIASGITHAEASPVSGNFRGTGAEAELKYEVKIEKID